MTSTSTLRARILGAALVGLAGANLGCSSHSAGGGNGFGTDDGTTVVDGGADGSVGIAVTDTDSGTGFFQASADATPQNVMFACQPGTYSGMFTTTVTTDAGLFPSLLSFDWTGMMSVTLVGHVTETMSRGGEIPMVDPVLTIAPGAMLSGTDNFGGHFVSGLAGQLDCPTKTLAGTLMNGGYDYPGNDAANIELTGSLTATYQDTPTPPSLTMGTISVGSPTYSTLAANGTWSATHQ